MDRAELESLDRETLVARALEAGIRRARILTRPEIVDELLRLDPNADAATLRRTRGFFGVARDLLSKVVERGLHLPDAIDRLRATGMGTLPPSVPRTEAQAVPTVTLAEIYAAQGHKERAVETLRRVLDREPDHAAAQALLARLTDSAYVPPPPPLPPEPNDGEPPPPQEDEGEEDDEEEVPISAVAASFPAPVAAAVTPVAPVAPPPECIAIPIGRAVHVSWQAEGRGALVLRAVVIAPSWDGPVREVRDIALDDPSGELVLRGLPDRAIVRAAVGNMHDARFVPVAHSPALERSGEGLVTWSFRGTKPVEIDHPRATAILRAAEAARQAAS